MLTIYGELITRVDAGENFYVDFETRSIKVGKQFLVKNGEYDAERTLSFKPTMDVMQAIEEFYHSYKYSLPSERNSNKRKKYFKALSADEMTDSQLAIGCKRDGAQARLEGFILCMVLHGYLKWDEDTMGKWFWQSKNDPDLVILRSWIENKNN
jgi:hypothetical protein